MAKNIIRAFFAADDGDEDESRTPETAASEDAAAAAADAAAAGARPRSMSDAWERIAEQNRRLDARLEAMEALQKQLVEVTKDLHDTAKDQVKILNYLGKFHEAAEKRGREWAAEFRGVPDVLRTLPSATKEQAERLSEIAARLYEKAQDNTVSAMRAAQANHQRTVEDLIDKSLGKSRQATWAAVLCAAMAVIVTMWVWINH